MTSDELSSRMASGEYYTTLEVAKKLGLAIRSIQLMVDRGDLEAWKTPGGHRRITRESVNNWIQNSRVMVTGVPALHVNHKSKGGRQRVRSHIPRILLLEDSAHHQNLVRMLVHNRFPSIDLHVADDGISGLVSFGHLQPDLIIVDILMPGIDGAALVMGLKRHALLGDCKLVVLTGLDEAQRAPYDFALHDVTVVQKPDLVRELPPMIEAAVGHLIPHQTPQTSA